MDDAERRQLMAAALHAATQVLMDSGHRVDAVVLLAELNHEGITIAATDDRVDNLSAVLAEASVRAAGAGA